MKRKFLEDLGLEEEAINKIMAENGKDLNELKAKVDDLTEQINVKDTTIKQKSDKKKMLPVKKAEFDGKNVLCQGVVFSWDAHGEKR